MQTVVNADSELHKVDIEYERDDEGEDDNELETDRIAKYLLFPESIAPTVAIQNIIDRNIAKDAAAKAKAQQISAKNVPHVSGASEGSISASASETEDNVYDDDSVSEDDETIRGRTWKTKKNKGGSTKKQSVDHTVKNVKATSQLKHLNHFSGAEILSLLDDPVRLQKSKNEVLRVTCANFRRSDTNFPKANCLRGWANAVKTE